MLTALFKYLHQHVALDNNDIAEVEKRVRIQAFSRGELLLREGQISKAFYFNLSGFVRLFYTRDSGEKTAFFYSEGQFISAYESYLHQTPARFNLQATEASQVVVFSQECAMHLLQYSSKFEKLARIALEKELQINQQIIGSLISMNPEERYLHLMAENPEVFLRVPQHYIASYIGVKPESLSRIKKRALGANS